MSEESKMIQGEGVSRKLKIFVIILTAVTIMAFLALFTKLASKQIAPRKNATLKPSINNGLSYEYEKVGTRLMNSGLRERAIDQFIRVWELQKFGSTERTRAAKTIGRLYAELGNCQEALVWLFRAETSDSEKQLTPLIDTCLAKIRSNISDQ